MLVIPTIDTHEKEVKLEVSQRDNGCIVLKISENIGAMDAILNDEEKKELIRWLS